MAVDLGKLGVKTTLCYRGNKLLRGFDGDALDFIAQELKRKLSIFIDTPKLVELKDILKGL
jgi:hypothetical protein